MRLQIPLKVKNDLVILDATDVRILHALQQNARQTYTVIGRQLGTAHSTVYDRIKKMEQYGIVRRYTALLDPEKTGVRNVMAMITVYTDPKVTEKVAQKISEAVEALEVYTSLSEELQIMAKVVADTQESLHEFIANFVAPMPGVLRVRTSIVTKKFKEEQFAMLDLGKVNIYKRST